MSISDPLNGLSALSCTPAQPARLAPGDALTCTADYAAKQAEIDAGEVKNTATVTGTATTGSTVSDDATLTIPAPPAGKIRLTKSANTSSVSSPGEVVTYTFAATNAGNVTLSDVSISDPLKDLSALSCSQPVTLVPGEVLTRTADYTSRKTTKNTAVASGEFEPGKRVDSTDTVRVKVAKRQACPIIVKVVKPKPKKAGNRLLVKRIKTNSKCKRVKPIVICRPLGRSASGETAFCVTKVSKRGRIRVNTRGYDAVRVRVIVRAKPKPKQRDSWKANTWRRIWILR